MPFKICDGNGDKLSDGLTRYRDAEKAAQAHADRLMCSVYLYDDTDTDETAEQIDPSVQGAAAYLLSYLTTIAGTDRICTKDEAPDDVKGAIRDCHGTDMLPDDWRYSALHTCLEGIANGYDDHETIDGCVDVYNSARVAWLASHIDRASYVDDAAAEGLSDGRDLYASLGAGQYREASDVYGQCLTACEAFAADRADP